MAGIRHLENHLLALCVEYRLDRQLHEVLRLVVGNLLPVHRQGLCEVAITIEESDGSHVDTAVAGFLNVVTSQDAQAARINLEGVAQTILHAEVCHRWQIVTHGLAHIAAEVLIDRVDAVEQRAIFDNLVEALRLHLLQ